MNPDPSFLPPKTIHVSQCAFPLFLLDSDLLNAYYSYRTEISYMQRELYIITYQFLIEDEVLNCPMQSRFTEERSWEQLQSIAIGCEILH